MPNSVNAFLEAMACRAVLMDVSSIPFDDASTSRKLGRILRAIKDRATAADRSGQADVCDKLLEILEALSPDANTGAYDNFLSALRSLQPTYAGVWNPTLYALKFDVDRAIASRTFDNYDPSLKQVAESCAACLAS